MSIEGERDRCGSRHSRGDAVAANLARCSPQNLTPETTLAISHSLKHLDFPVSTLVERREFTPMLGKRQVTFGLQEIVVNHGSFYGDCCSFRSEATPLSDTFATTSTRS